MQNSEYPGANGASIDVGGRASERTRLGRALAATGLAEALPRLGIERVAGEDGELVLRAELPGVTAEAIDLVVDEDELTISGEFPGLPVDDGLALLSERPEGPFEHSFYLPTEVDPARIEARLSDGVLEVRMPRAERGARRIPVVDGGDARAEAPGQGGAL